MGCCVCSHENLAATAAVERSDSQIKQYSWDVKEKESVLEELTIENLRDETTYRNPATVSGRQLIIQNCEKSNIYVFDHLSSVTIDRCNECSIVLGPVRNSVCVRECQGSRLMLACQQLRVASCLRSDLFVCSTSRPFIESSSYLKFGCFQFYYKQLEDHFHRAHVSAYNNNWHNIDDASQLVNEANCTLLPEDCNVEEYFPSAECWLSVNASVEPDKSIVPYILNAETPPSDKCCLVVFFSDGLSHKRANTFIREMKRGHSECRLMRSREMPMTESDARLVFNTDHYALAVRQGPVIGLEYSGVESCRCCHETLVSVSQGSTGLVFVSSSTDSARNQIDNFFRLSVPDMQLLGRHKR